MQLRIALVLCGVVGCTVQRAPCAHDADALHGAVHAVFAVPHFDKRDYTLHLPPAYRPGTAVPVVFAFHGGGGSMEGAFRVTCAGGNTGDSGCLSAVADDEGFAVVSANGTSDPFFDDVRTWNAGGGGATWQCVSSTACDTNVDEMAYLDALFDEVTRAITVDTARVYATGLSNGGAMVHRLACERSQRFAAVASVAGGNQFAMVQGCTPARAVSVLEIHGTADPCWDYAGGRAACVQADGNKVGALATVQGWAENDGCTLSAESTPLDDRLKDGTTSVVHTFDNCDAGAQVQLVEVKNGGHTWPGGESYAREGAVGKVAQDFAASRFIWDFFAAHPMRVAD